MGSVIGYNQPNISAKDAAALATKILKDVEKLGGDSLYYCMKASNILALAGLRALSPYNEFHPNYSEEKLQKLNEILTKHNCRLLKQDEYGSEPSRRDFSIMNVTSLQDTENRYPITKDAPLKPPSNPTWTSYTQWTLRMWIHYANLIHDSKLPKKWLQNWYVPHDIHFGMMLGYPGIALGDSCERGIGEIDRDKDMDWAEVDVHSSGLYDGTDVSYAVRKDHLKSPEVIRHLKLWQETLDIVYAEYSDVRLKSIRGFSDEDKRVNKYYRET